MTQTLQDCRPDLFIEIHKDGCPEILRLLFQESYRIVLVEKDVPIEDQAADVKFQKAIWNHIRRVNSYCD